MNPTVVCKVLETPHEKSAAHAIVKRLYLAEGYAIGEEYEGIAGIARGPHARLFGLYSRETLFGTVAVVTDSEKGLPMDSIYKDELNELRRQNARLVEVVQFAVDHEAYQSFFGKKAPFIAANLFAEVLSFALRESVDYLCVSINPKHDTFYAALGFIQTGEQKTYPLVNAPAIARVLYVPEWSSSSFLRTMMESCTRLQR